MGKGLLATLTFVVGLIVGGVGGGMMGVGTGAGVGIATGLSAGVCGIANAAQQEGLLTEEQVDQVFNRAISNLKRIDARCRRQRRNNCWGCKRMRRGLTATAGCRDVQLI